MVKTDEEVKNQSLGTLQCRLIFHPEISINGPIKWASKHERSKGPVNLPSLLFRFSCFDETSKRPLKERNTTYQELIL